MIKLVPIVPKTKAINFNRFATAAQRGLRDAAEDAVKDFEKTTATWKTAVVFTIKEQKDGFVIGTDNRIWIYGDKGTRAHRIVAHRKRLRFGIGGRAKTRPGFIGSQAGARGGGQVFARAVNHPGTTARGWSKLIAAKYKAQMSRYIDKRIKEAM